MQPRLFEGNPVGEGTTRRGTATPVHRPQRPAGSTHSSTRGLSPLSNSRGQRGSLPHLRPWRSRASTPQLAPLSLALPQPAPSRARTLEAGKRWARQRNVNNLRYADDTTLMAESEEELKSLLMKVKVESEKAGLNCRFFQTMHGGVSDPSFCVFIHRVAFEEGSGQGVSGPSSSCVWNPRVFADDARGWQCPFVLCAMK